MIYALREALRIIAEEGLEARFARHRLNHLALVAGVEAMGLSMLVPEARTAAHAQRDPHPARRRRQAGPPAPCCGDFGIEIGGGLGEFAGKVWRVGLMGHASCRKNVLLFLAALETILKAEGFAVRPGALDAAHAILAAV